MSYNFNKGKMYSLMGPSGSGKSTLLNLISLIDRPSLGSIKFNDKLVNFQTIKTMIFLELKILVLFINKIIYFRFYSFRKCLFSKLIYQ